MNGYQPLEKVSIVLYLYVYIAPLAVPTNRTRFQNEIPREKRAVQPWNGSSYLRSVTVRGSTTLSLLMIRSSQFTFCLSVCFCCCQSFKILSVCLLAACLSVCLSVCQLVCLAVSLSVGLCCQSVCVRQSVCVQSVCAVFVLSLFVS